MCSYGNSSAVHGTQWGAGRGCPGDHGQHRKACSYVSGCRGKASGIEAATGANGQADTAALI
jgi:hypothetical protein